MRAFPVVAFLVAVSCSALAQGVVPAAPTSNTPASTTPASTTPAPATPAARSPSPAQAAQQEKMRSCNASAGERNFAGQARRDYMATCLAGKQTPQTMMKVCNAEATQEKMTADARKTYLATCLKTS